MTGVAIDVAGLIPQAGVARLVQAVLDLREDGIDCAGRIPVRHPLVQAGAVPSFMGLEMAAQAAAVFEALRRRERDERTDPRVGFLVSLRDVRLNVPTLPAEVSLVASIRSLGGAAPLALYQVRVLHGDVVGVQGTLGTFLPPSEGQRGVRAP
jgi:predicted hotdog family 3-hydroxylacyl-ACP dehydratase